MLQQQPATVTHNIVITRELIELFKGFRVSREVDVFTIIIINISQTSSNKKNNICETCAKKCKCGAHYAEKAESGPTKSTFHPFLKKSLVKFSKHRQICRFPLKLKTKNTFLPFEVKPHKPAVFINATLHRWLTRRQSAVCSEQRSKLEKDSEVCEATRFIEGLFPGDYFLRAPADWQEAALWKHSTHLGERRSGPNEGFTVTLMDYLAVWKLFFILHVWMEISK